jgi:hypothetical protein
MKKALIVGINYINTSSQLNGCLNDATNWDTMLKSKSYETKLLIENDATKANILLCLLDLVTSLKKGDIGVFTYSGHGSYQIDTSKDEIDNKDEMLVPIDYNLGNLILDDELHYIFTKLVKGATFIMVADCCHSGTISKLFRDSTQPLSLSKYLNLSSINILKPLFITKNKNEAILISGCADSEVSMDVQYIDGAQGSFSKAALGCINKASNILDWHKMILNTIDTKQTPQLTATKYQKKLMI